MFVYVFVFTPFVYIYSWHAHMYSARLLTRPIHSVNLSESRISRTDVRRAAMVHAHWSIHMCECSMSSWLLQHVFVCDKRKTGHVCDA